MNSRTFPHQGPGRAGPPSGDPEIPGGPPRGRPFACGEAAVSPPPPAAFPSLLGPWGGRSRAGGLGRSAVWGGGRGRRGVHSAAGCELARSLSREPRGGGSSWKCGRGVWEGSKAGPEKTREVGWGKGKGGNWIRRAALLQGPHSEGSWGCCLLGLCCPFRRRGARSALRCWGKEKDMQRYSLLVRRGETRRGRMGY